MYRSKYFMVKTTDNLPGCSRRASCINVANGWISRQENRGSPTKAEAPGRTPRLKLIGLRTAIIERDQPTEPLSSFADGFAGLEDLGGSVPEDIKVKIRGLAVIA